MKSDPDQILMGGEQLYKSFSIQNDVDVEELRREIVVFSHTVTLEISKESLNVGKFVQRGTLYREYSILSNSANDSTGFTFFLCSYAVVLVRDQRLW